jgi:hypothetical protein
MAQVIQQYQKKQLGVHHQHQLLNLLLFNLNVHQVHFQHHVKQWKNFPLIHHK